MFAYKVRKKLYKCKLRTKLAHTDPEIEDNRVQFDFTCEYLITRPPFSAETYGYPKILYPPQENGVRKFLYTKEALELQKKAKEVARKLKIYYLTPAMGFGWSYTAINSFVFKRNKLVNDLTGTRKYKCNECQKLFYGGEMEIHHIRERTNGGSDTLANLNLLCLACHLIETWKLMTGKDEVPLMARWRKVIEAKNIYWKEKWRCTSYAFEERNLIKKLKRARALTPAKIRKLKEERKLTKSVEFLIEEAKRLQQQFEDELKEIYSKNKFSQWRLKFWDKYDKKTAKWSKNIKPKKNKNIDTSQFKTIDEFFE